MCGGDALWILGMADISQALLVQSVSRIKNEIMNIKIIFLSGRGLIVTPVVRPLQLRTILQP